MANEKTAKELVRERVAEAHQWQPTRSNTRWLVVDLGKKGWPMLGYGTSAKKAWEDAERNTRPAPATDVATLIESKWPTNGNPWTHEQPSAAQAEPPAHMVLGEAPPLSSFAEMRQERDVALRQLRQVQAELEEARKHLTLIVDDAVYSDSLGVEGSGFSVCRWCGGGSSPGKGDFAHNHGCIFEDGKLEEMSAQVWEKAEESLLAQLEDRAESAEQKLAVTTEALRKIASIPMDSDPYAFHVAATELATTALELAERSTHGTPQSAEARPTTEG